jgi:cytochrome c oxidase assembly factor CtaG
MATFHWHPEVALGLEALIAGYLLATGVLRRRFGWGPPPGRGRVAAFLGGTVILAGAVLGPLAEWAEHAALSAHMAQHLLLILVVPLLWLLGLPPWLLAPAARVPVVGRFGWWLTRPLPALALASAVQIAWLSSTSRSSCLGSSSGGRSPARPSNGRGRARPLSSSICSWPRSR